MRRFLVWAGASAGVAAWLAAGALTFDLPGLAAQEPIGRVGDASSGPGFPGEGPFFVLAIGSDARPGVCEPVERCLADSLHVIGVSPEERAASIVGIPRDAYVTIPGHGQTRINDSLFLGGPELVVQTVEDLVGVEIDYYFLTSFEGFRHMIEEIGGVQVEVPYPMSDAASGATLEAGPQLLDGRQALAFSRNRKDTPNGDFSRTENQGLVMLGALRQFQREVEKDPFRLFTWLVAGATYIDTEVPLGELFQLAVATLDIDPDRVTNVAMPGGLAFVGTASVVTVGGEAQAMFADLRDDGLLEA